MIRRSDVTVSDTLNTPLAGVYITVRAAGGAVAAIYADNAGTTKVNPFQSGSDGTFTYYAVAGVYTEEYRLTLAGQPRQVVAVTLSDNAIILTPEQYGANGLAATDQTAALEAMMVVARAAGKATIRLTEGSTYTTTNPHVWGNCRDLEIQGNRAKLMNARTGALGGVFDANFCAFRLPSPHAVNGAEVLTFGAGQGSGVQILGATVATVNPGDPTLTILAGTLEVGRAWLYAWDRFPPGGSPMNPAYFEQVYILSVVGATATLLQPVINRYDQNAPELTVGGTQGAGAARCMMLDRATDGTYRKSLWMDRLAVYDVEFIANPLITVPLVNGLAGFTGAEFIHLEGCRGTTAYVGSAGGGLMKNCVWAGEFEVDKLLPSFSIEGGEIDSLIGAIGTGRLSLGGRLQIHKSCNVAPMEELFIGDVKLRAKNGVGDTFLINDYNGYGSFKTIIDGPTIIVDNVTADRLINPTRLPWTPTTITTTTLGSTRAAWDAGLWATQIRVGSVFYINSIAVGEITSMPTVPVPPLLTGDIQIGYKLLGGAIPAATPIYMTPAADVEIRKYPTLEGPYARQVQEVLGANQVGANNKLARIKGPKRRDTEFEIDFHKLVEFYANGQAMYSFGRAFCMTGLLLRVTRAAVDAGAVSMFLGGDKADGTGVGIINSVDLKTLGERELTWSTSSGLRGLGADSLGGTITVTIATPGVVTLNSHGLTANQTVQFRTTGALPTGLTALTTYYVRNPAANTFEVSLTSGGASIATTGTQSGVHTIYGLPIDPMVSLRVFDNSRALTEGNRAAGKIIVKGYFA